MICLPDLGTFCVSCSFSLECKSRVEYYPTFGHIFFVHVVTHIESYVLINSLRKYYRKSKFIRKPILSYIYFSRTKNHVKEHKNLFYIFLWQQVSFVANTKDKSLLFTTNVRRIATTDLLVLVDRGPGTLRYCSFLQRRSCIVFGHDSAAQVLAIS